MKVRPQLWVALGLAVAAYLLIRGPDIVDSLKRLIAGEEGLRLTVYRDTGGAWTIGYGHLVKAGEPYFPYGNVRTITQEQADALFEADTRAARSAVASSVKQPLTENMRNALTSLAFNIGGSAFATSTLVKRLNAGDIAGAAQQFDVWVFDNHVKVPGLVARRAREKTLFLS